MNTLFSFAGTAFKVHFKTGISILLVFSVLLFSCSKDAQKSSGSSPMKFEKLTSVHTGIKFNNELKETEEENVLIYDGFYTGAGVAILDINNDGLQDVFFVSNQNADKLYLNKGQFKFEDISSPAGIEGGNEWGGGVAIADVNSDGYDDIYVCCHMYLDPDRRRNKLYINNQNNTFSERAKEYGLDDPGFSIHAAFFDYDLDGDLDLYVVNQPPNHNETRNPIMSRGIPDFQYSDHLYRNEGQGKFTNVTESAGVQNFAFGLSATVGDFFNDGYPDIYIANDYDYGDFLYVNNGNGTFKNVSTLALKHISNFSMGADAADINNDGWLDIFVADMTPEDHYRNKTNMAAMSPETFWKFANSGHNFQYMFNTLQLNQGNGLFSEIGLMAGVGKTDWSWSAFFTDFDLDGYKDLYVTNGILRDIRNRDFTSYAFEAFEDKSIPRLEIIQKGPSMPLSNYMYHNDGSLHFDNVSAKWGLEDKSFSQGSAYADLDNDGDVDLVVNNTNQEAFVYKNLAADQNNGNYLRLQLIGEQKNPRSFGARVQLIYDNNKIQLAELYNTRGYMSCSEPFLTFGLAEADEIDSVIVRWPGGKTTTLQKVKANKTLQLKESEATLKLTEQLMQRVPFILTEEVSEKCFDKIAHRENEYDDYKREVLIPYKQSTLGPALETGDLNQDGLDDIFLSNSSGTTCQLLLQTGGDKFVLSVSQPWAKYGAQEVTDVTFFDADNDGDIDIYTVSGSNEFPEGSPLYADHLYLNDGNANFTDATQNLPKLLFSKSCAEVADIDGDGDLDIFLGGRLVPGKYGLSERSAILINDKAVFTDRTQQWCSKMLERFECVTSACFTDIDQDLDADLVVVGEWSTVRIFKNELNKYTEATNELKTDSLFGWWNIVIPVDLNNDGKTDLVLGNLGLNSKFKASKEKPFYLYINDFDKNGTWDTYLASKSKEGKLYPVRGRQCSSEQMPFILDKFKNYDQFAKASIEEILEGKMDGATKKMATEFKSIILYNHGSEGFKASPLPVEAQLSTLQSMAFYDFNQDGISDILVAGNYYNREVETARNDANVGQILLNTPQGNFVPVSNAMSGLKLQHDLREMRIVRGKNKYFIVAANNHNLLQAFLIR
ncbi:MAG: VCBS repeat-containing protein [Saprospiraceae bacterium]|nr:VCBS repeat-containing protein [Saprospiraceae bacterium]